MSTTYGAVVSPVERDDTPSRPLRRTLGAIVLIVAPLAYLAAEQVAAAAWHSPRYSFVHDFISDLGAPDCSSFEGRDICSPLHAVMNAGFIQEGVLLIVGVALLAGLLQGVPRLLTLVSAAITGIGFVLVGTFHGSTAATADGTVAFHFLGAYLVLLGGNVMAILVGLQLRRLDSFRPAGLISILIGAIGLVAAIALTLMFNSGIAGVPERISVDAIAAWQIVAGLTLLRARRRAPVRPSDRGDRAHHGRPRRARMAP